ncbi:DUF58 domain-containing protein [Nocardioides mesophilus]|uniref:DUF58 domain-containing protein n=1 Tax=Nocardioides mesophilus TaxID=433659 RepID=A0A7G9R843_9ACTN|nr:DUF58 domain-containing protein [Nocardioides mesophilus]QNN51768.1 DUF58 domain-containing protein [Nocardioides mesophilus]
MSLQDLQVSAGWRPTAALSRAAVLSAVLAVAAVLLGRPDLLVLGVPFLVHAAVVVVRRPAGSPAVESRLAHTAVREGEATAVSAHLTGCEDAEHALVAVQADAYQATRPGHGVVGAALAADQPEVTLAVPVASQRWGRRTAGEGLVAATGPWAGRRWGPHPLRPMMLTTLPVPGVFDSRAPSPHPIGLVGTHQARRPGQGGELADIRPFQPGDRLRRIHWRQSLRTGSLHVTGTIAEEDSSVLLLVDALTEVGRSGGTSGAASTLDVAVRAAGALAEHYLHQGDRVGMRVLGENERSTVPVSGGRRHLRRILDTLARVVPGQQQRFDAGRLRLRVPAGAVVIVLSPMLSDEVVTATVTLARSGITVVVVDTLPGGRPGRPDSPPDPAGPPAATAAGTLDIDLLDAPGDRRRRLAWRMRMVERDLLLGRVVRAGVPVVPWRGPGTLDTVLRGLRRRARSPRLVSR